MKLRKTHLKKLFFLIVAACLIIYVINGFVAAWHLFRTLNGFNEDEITCYDMSLPGDRQDHRFYVYTKASLIPSFIPQDLSIIKNSRGDLSIWYGGRLSTFPGWPWSVLKDISKGEEYSLEDEAARIDKLEEIVNKDLKKRGFWKLTSFKTCPSDSGSGVTSSTMRL